MAETIYREKSLEKIKSPENLQEYLRVANPAVWMLLAAIILLLLGAGIWGVYGRAETVVSAAATAENGLVTCLVESESVEAGMPLRLAELEGQEFTVDAVEESAGGYTVTAQCAVEDGSYTAQIVTESLRPLSFLFN